jgi:hypothetical protein
MNRFELPRSKVPAIPLLGVLALLAGVAALPAGGAGAATARPPLAARVLVGTDRLEREAELIFTGSVVDVQPRRLANGAIITDARVRVSGRLKGASDPEVIVSVLGGALDDETIYVTNQPQFAPGEGVLVFAKRDTALGGLAVVAGEQGKLHLQDGWAIGGGRRQSVTALVAEIRGAAARQTRSLPPVAASALAPSLPTRVNDTAYALRGYHFEGTVHWSFNPAVPAGATVSLPAAMQAQAAAQGGFQAWAQNSGLSVAYDGQTAAQPDVICLRLGTCTFDSKNVIGWITGLDLGEMGRTVCAVATSSGVVLDCDLGLSADGSGLRDESNQPYGWSLATPTPDNAFDLPSVLLHEEGHVLGLAHSWAPMPDCSGCPSYESSYTQAQFEAVMYYKLGPGAQKRTLSAGDIAGIQALYGGPLPTCPGGTPGAAPGPARLFLPLVRGGGCKP